MTVIDKTVHSSVREIAQQPAASVTEIDGKRERCERNEDSKLPPGQLNKIHETVAAMKELDRDLSKAKTITASSTRDPYVIWEVQDCKPQGQLRGCPAHRRAFFQKQEQEKPDGVIYSPVCRLWSPTQEPNRTKSVVYAANLELKRQEDHENRLTFVAVSYEKQRKEGHVALVEHPWSARSWRTEAFSRTQGYDTRVDMCEYGLQLPDDEGNINPVQKATCVRTTSPIIYNQLWRECSGD